MKGSDRRSSSPGAIASRSRIAAPIGGLKGEPSSRVPSSASSANTAPTAKKPIGSSAITMPREMSTRTLGANEAGAITAAIAA